MIEVRPALDPIQELKAGQVWATTCRPKNENGNVVCIVPVAHPVIIFWPGNGSLTLDNIIRVIPTSADGQTIDEDGEFNFDYVLEEVEVKGEDVLCETSSSVGYYMLAEVWNESPMLAGNLNRFLGRITEANLKKIAEVRQRLLSDEKKRRRYSFEQKLWRSRELRAWRFLSAPVNLEASDA